MTLKDRLTSLREEVVSYKFWKAVRCEFLSTLLYVFIGCGSCTAGDKNSMERTLVVGLAFGLAEATFVQCVGHISGAHLNPAISIAMLVTRNISVVRAICYVFAQCVGAIAGAGILYGLTPSQQGHIGVTHVQDTLQNGQAFGIEFMITFVVVFTFFANLEQKRTEMGSRSLSIGLSVTLGHLFAVSFTKR